MTPDEYTISEQQLDVGDGHKLYVHEWGNKDATTPIIFLHGGPGASCSNRHKLLFDPTKQRVVFHDQRGCGKSTPYGYLRHNTTQALSADITTIAERLELDRYLLAGGSWGSCLALFHALEQPQRVRGLALTGIFTGSQAETDWVDKGQFRTFYPEVWDEYLDHTPVEHHADPTAYHLSRVFQLDDQVALESAHVYDTVVGKIYALDDRFAPEDPTGIDLDSKKIELNFLRNHYYLADNYILDHAAELTMPTWLVQGRYDMLCPPVTAYRLHQAMPNSQLIWTQANHRSEHEDTTVLRTAIAQLCEAVK